MIDNHDLVFAIAERAKQYLLDPPSGEDPVVDLASPDELIAAFDSTVGLALAADGSEPNHDNAELLAAIDLVVRHSMHTSHPRFVNQNFAGPDPVAVAGDWLGAALNTTGATFEVAPVFTLMEAAVIDRLARLAGYVSTDSELLPALPSGLFCPGGSVGTLFGLQLARHRHDRDITTRGPSGERLTVFVSASGHYAATKSAALMGIGTDNVVKVPCHFDGSIDVAELAEAIRQCMTTGGTPLAVIATSGTTVTSAFDDLHGVADVCKQHGIWMHVDGCYGGSSLFSPAQAHRLSGVERSDSFVWNLHKMMGMTQQCTALLVKQPEQLAACFATRADYLFQPDKQFAEYDSGDRTFQCARRIDVLKAWLAWKTHGDEGFAARIDHAVAMGTHTRHAIAARGDRFVTVVDGDFTNVVFVWVPPELRPLSTTDPAALPIDKRDALHLLPPAIKARMQRDGTAMIGFQPVHGMNTFRMICMNSTLRASDIDAILDAIERYGADAVGGSAESMGSTPDSSLPPQR